MNIRDYIATTERTYGYRIKSIVPLEDHEMKIIENVIMKYDPFDISEVRKLMFQQNPLDFRDIETGAEVYVVDVTLGLPVSPSVLRIRLVKALAVADKFVVVRGVNDPMENETQRLNAENEMYLQAIKDGLIPQALLDDPEYKEAVEVVGADLYGDEYNSRFLNYVRDASDRRKAEIVVAPKSPLFGFLDPTATTQTAARDSLQTDNEADGKNPASTNRSIQGNYDGDTRQFRRVFKTKAGGEKVLSATANGVRKTK